MGIVRTNAPLRVGEIQRLFTIRVIDLIAPARRAITHDHTQTTRAFSKEAIGVRSGSGNRLIHHDNAVFVCSVIDFTGSKYSLEVDSGRNKPSTGIQINGNHIASLQEHGLTGNQLRIIAEVGIAILNTASSFLHIDIIGPIGALGNINRKLQLAIFSGSKAVKICIITIQINRAFAHNQIIRITFSAYCGSSQRNIELLILKKAIANQRQLVNLTSIQLQAVCTVDFGIVPVHTVIDIPVIVGSCTINGQQNILFLSMDNQGNLIFGIQVNHLIKADSQIIAVGYCESCHRQHCQNHCQHNQNAN